MIPANIVHNGKMILFLNTPKETAKVIKMSLKFTKNTVKLWVNILAI